MAETIGQQLKQVRLERHLSIDKVVETTRIRAQYIEAIEADEFDALPSPVQARAFLRNYAEFLGLSLDELIARQAGTTEAAAPLPAPEPEPAPAPRDSTPPITREARNRIAELTSALAGKVKNRVAELTAAIAGKAKTVFSRIKWPVRAASKRPSTAEAEPIPVDTVEEAGPQVVESPLPIEKPPAGTSQAIFTAIGKSLQKRREMLSLTLEEIERHTHVRAHYLKALEEGDFDHLPSSVQGRGMLNNYARFLDMDVDSLLLQFAEGLQALRLEHQPQPSAGEGASAGGSRLRVNLPPAIKRYLSMDIIVGGGLVVMLVGFAIWGTTRIIGLRGATTPQPTAPSISDILGSASLEAPGTASPIVQAGTGTFIPAEAGTAAISMPASGPGAVHVVIVALQSAWVRVVVDGKMQFEGRIASGSATPYDGNTQIEVLTGNGAAVSIIYNESDLGSMGAIGEVVDHIYTADSILNPTPTFTPSPTITPKPSITPRPSPTVRPSATPKK